MLEQELKLTAKSSQVLVSIASWGELTSYRSELNIAGPARFLAVYYDTVERLLEKEQSSLRSRFEGSKWKAAFKLKGEIVNGLSQREELECEVDGWLNGVNDLPEGVLKSRVCQRLAENALLYPIVTIDMQRTIIDLQIHHSQVELVLDNGVISANNKQQSLYEVELELKSGEIEPMLEFGNRMQHHFRLQPSMMTKHQIGLSL